MKKILSLLTLACAVCGAMVSAAEFDWAESSAIVREIDRQTGVDAAAVERALQFTSDAAPSTDEERERLIRINVLARFHTAGADLSWEAQKKFVDEQIAAAAFEKPLSTEKYLMLLYIWYCRKWDGAIYDLMKTLPGCELWCDAGYVCDKLGKYEEAYNYYVSLAQFPARAVDVAVVRLNDPARAFAAAQLILERTYDAECVGRVIARVVSGLVGRTEIPAEQMKSFLQNANRKYSPKLIEDDAAWRPVITTIRTLLETY